MTKQRTGALASIVVAGALVLAGCTTTTDMNGMDHGASPATSDASFNAADEAFLVGMIPHHEQALEMAELVLAKDDVDERVVELAQRIQAAQQPEIDLMTSWLEDWGLDPDLDGMGGMDHGSDGMMSDQDMAALEAASGPDASTLFLSQMIQHHTGAIVMAQQELDNGRDAQVLDLAQQIIDAQTAEIAEMEQLLTQL
ncbi:DUF305 domain-containing protein [Pseudolysinimonas yzui]|uniref:DUF305 domain-containing protein n=1 Tax=Pseudolysinimonas yzui TaxID=2708254 RepID=A0A8J3GMJ1_9MICO|nr:DUF305 domain-containing protein [Pseudolysinimonas yzui]GHF04090.1 DUF305 domain-containing protein [Pseudolysinimonas yzui]